MDNIEHDCISRKAVIDVIDKWVKNMHVLMALPANEVTPLFDNVHELPPVTPQPKTGRWIHNKCNKCGASRPPLFDNFCPNCGFKMEVKE